MNETLINLLQQGRKSWSEKRKKKEDAIMFGCQWSNTSGRAAARSIAVMNQCNANDKRDISSDDHFFVVFTSCHKY